jgi:hypothetical protein
MTMYTGGAHGHGQYKVPCASRAVGDGRGLDDGDGGGGTHGCHRRGDWPALRQREVAQQDNEAIPVSQFLKLALCDGHLQRLLLSEVRRLDLCVDDRCTAIVIVVSLVIKGATAELAGEEADVAEVAYSLAWVELLRPRGVPVRGVRPELWIIL